MRHPLVFSLLFLAPLAFLAQTGFAAPVDFFPSEIFCERSNSADQSIAFNGLVARIASQHSSLIARDLGAAYSIGPINHAITALRPKEICASGIALTKNIYGYHEYLFTLQLRLQSGELRMMPILFQASSVQGHHGIGVNPWMGVPRTGLLALAEKEFGELEFRPTTATNLSELLNENIIRRDYEWVEEGSTSILPILDANGKAKFYVVGEYFRIPNQNPFLEVSGSRGLALRLNGNHWEVARIGSLFGFYQGLDELKKTSAPGSNSNEAITARLIEISK